MQIRNAYSQTKGVKVIVREVRLLLGYLRHMGQATLHLIHLLGNLRRGSHLDMAAIASPGWLRICISEIGGR